MNKDAHVDKIEIPSKLMNEKYKFCLVKKGDKKPFEKDWPNKGYKQNDIRLRKHLANGGNYGVICGQGFVRVLDIDNKELADKLTESAQTFTVETGSGCKHFYFKSTYSKNHTLPEGKGEFRSTNQMVVGPTSIHPNGNSYKVVKDLPIQEVTEEEIVVTLESLGVSTTKNKTSSNSQKDTSRSAYEFGVICGLIKQGLSKEQIFEKMLRYAKWSESTEQYRDYTYEKALKKIEEGDAPNTNVEFISAKDLCEGDWANPQWLIKGLIKENGVVLLSGEPGSAKSYSSLHIAVASAGSKPAFGKIESEKIKVLYIDEENRASRLKNRLKLILIGLDLKPEDVEIYFLINSGLKLDSYDPRNKMLVEQLMQFLIDKQIDVAIIDSLVRVMTGTENDVKDVRKIFETVKKISEECSTAFFLIHHTRKTNNRYNTRNDIRGSGDFLAMVDAAFNFSMVGDNTGVFRLDKFKDRDADGVKPFTFEIVSINDPEEGLYNYELERGVQFVHLSETQSGGLRNLQNLTEERLIEFMRKSDKGIFKNAELFEVASQYCKKSTYDKAMVSLQKKKGIEKIGRGLYKYIGNEFAHFESLS